MQFTKTIDINATPQEVWTVFAHGFDDAYKWMASVPRSYAKTNGELFEGARSAGRVCELKREPTGLKATEKFTAYNEATKTCTIRIDFLDAPFLFPVHHNAVTFSVVGAANGRAKVTLALLALTGVVFLPWRVTRWRHM